MLAVPEEFVRFGLKETMHCRVPACGAKERRWALRGQKNNMANHIPFRYVEVAGIYLPRHTLCFSCYRSRTLIVREARILAKMLKRPEVPTRLSRLTTVAGWMVVILGVKVLVGILLEYRFYFPADFEATFLIGRRESFPGIYSIGFYLHILTAPVAFVLGAFLMWSGTRARYPVAHHWAGRVQIGLILLAVVPSGLVMSAWALTGPIAGAGFALQSVATGACAILAVWYAVGRKFAIHQRWATRCFILLAAPLLFRVVGGVLFVTGTDTPESYQINAWASWILPLLAYDAWRIHRTRGLPIHYANPNPKASEVMP